MKPRQRYNNRFQFSNQPENLSDPHLTSYLMVLKVSKVLKVSQDLAVFPQDFQDFIFVKTLEGLVFIKQ